MIRSRRETYLILVSIAVGMILTGLAVPWVAGDRVDSLAGGQSTASSDVSPGDASLSSTTTTSMPATSDISAATPGSGSATSGPVTGGGGATRAAATSASATDVGVTPTTVKIGFLLLDVGNVGKVGVGVPGIDPKQQQQAIQVEIDQINKAGGINGRAIEPVYRPFDVLSQDDMRAACLDVTEDAKVFAVVAAGGYEPNRGLCVTKEHQTPLVAWCCASEEVFAQSQGRMFTVYAGARRIMNMWAGELHRTNRLQGKKIGVLNDERYDPGENMAKTSLLPALSRHGYSVTHLSRLSQDLSTGASQIPNEVQQMRLKGVDTVLLTANTIYVAQFTQQADAQGWRPTYYTSDWAGLNTDATNANNPRSYDGSLSWTVGRSNEWRVGIPEPAPAKACRERYEKATGKKLERNSETAEYSGTVMWCDLNQLLWAGLRGAGTSLTRGSFAAGLENAGPVPFGNIGGGALRPGRRDAAEQFRMQRWSDECKCWKPAGDFQPMPA